MTQFTVLHVSDVHFGYSTSADQRRITKELVTAVHEHVQSEGRAPDLCIFSGDLTQSAAEVEFKQGEEWLRQLLKPFPGCDLFVVPGNHDVVRSKETNHQLTLRGAATNQKQYEQFRKNINVNLHHLQNFQKWHRAAKQSGLRLVSDWDKSLTSCRRVINKPELDTVVIGLNSALLSCSDDDKSNLTVDIDDFTSLLEGCESKTQLMIVVSHHPISLLNDDSNENWLTSWNKKLATELLFQRTGPHVYLHGHLHHDFAASVEHATGQRLHQFAAGAAYQNTKYPLRFGFYDINLEKREIKPWIYSYSRNAGDWTFVSDASRAIVGALPFPSRQNLQGSLGVEDLQVMARELFECHAKTHKIVLKYAPQLAPDVDFSLPERERFLEKEVAQYANAPLITEIKNDKHLSAAFKDRFTFYVEAGNFSELINELTKIESNLLITALILSGDEKNIGKAEDLLTKFGRAFHYSRLGFIAWSKKNLTTAIKFAQRAEELAREHTTEDPLFSYSTSALLKNNLAYYYAELGDHKFEESAKKLAKEALELQRLRKKEDIRLANFTDTAGFVKIAFSSNRAEIEDGISLCEKARNLGGDLTMYFKHIVYASSRIDHAPKNKRTAEIYHVKSELAAGGKSHMNWSE